jgi:thiol-disulfide isomerase/thioredoxin
MLSQALHKFLSVIPAFAGMTLALLASGNALAVEVGAPAPPTVGPSLIDQKPLSLAALKGRVVLVDFWASWCGPCKVSLPQMQLLRDELYAQGYGARFEVLAINVDDKTDKALKFLSKQTLTYPMLSDPAGKLPEAYALPSMPSSYLIAPDGRVHAVHAGYKPGDAQAKFKPEILQLLGAKP